MLCAFPLARPVEGFKPGDGLMVADVKRTLTVFPLEGRPSTALFSYRTKNPEKASTVIMKLSDFLRYQLYDNNQPSVLLLSEIQFLNDFMELEKIRRDDFNFRLTIENEDSNSNMISQLVLPPNLFTTFIENAIKHSADLDHPSKIDITFKIYKKELVFTCSNTKPAEPIDEQHKGGLGLANIKRRLDLLYAKDYKLDINDDDKQYTVTLTLPI